MRKIGIALVVGLGFGIIGCSVSPAGEESAGEEDVGESKGALGFTITPASPNKRIVRPEGKGCPTVATAAGTWTGAPIASGQLVTAFCAYTWTSAARNAVPDDAALRAIAKFDERLGRDFSISDPRAGNAAPHRVTTSEMASFAGELGYTTEIDPTPRSSGCDVCIWYGYDYFWYVLPPDAYGQTVYLNDATSTYAFNGASGSVFYSSVPSGFSGTPYLTW